MAANGWRVSEVPLRAFWLQPFTRLLAEVTLRWESSGWQGYLRLLFG